jgi:hypothetical protein
MRTILLGLLAVTLHTTLNAQLQLGGSHAGFTIDADTKVGYSKYGPPTASIFNDDDWFLPTAYAGIGKGVLDTTGASVYLSRLQAYNNITFTQRMSVPMYTAVNGRLWLDALYCRDFNVKYDPAGTTVTSNDSTGFTNSAKNGLNPNTNWQGGSASFPNKTELIDGYAHMRRDGTSIYDSLWINFAVSTLGVNGDRYFDIELFKERCGYNPVTGAFSTSGPDGGHTSWKFDGSGNVTQTGDMIVSVTYSPGSAPVIDLRIWVSSTTYSTVNPTYFNFNGVFDGSGSFGYAQIVSNNGNTAWGSGIGNYSGTAANDTTYATPWGTAGLAGGTNIWSAQYSRLQLVEIGLNLSRIGVDAALYTAQGINPCEAAFYSVIFKSRSSSSFTANLQDFVGPLDFNTASVVDYNLANNNLSCSNSTGQINITNPIGAAIYKWSTNNGSITGSNTDSTQLTVGSVGTYFLEMSPYTGCPSLRKDTVLVTIDNYQPVASSYFTANGNQTVLYLHGGNAPASQPNTPFGTSQGITWEWSGPGGFTSSVQNPSNTYTLGTYQLIVTETRNGCKDTATLWVDMSTLAAGNIKLTGNYRNGKTSLQWQKETSIASGEFVIEKSINGTDFSVIGKVNLTNTQSDYKFDDASVTATIQYYRIKLVSSTQTIKYSNIVKLEIKSSQNSVNIIHKKGNASFVINGMQTGSGTVNTVLFSLSGKQVAGKEGKTSGSNFSVEMNYPSSTAPGVYIIATYVDKKLIHSQKLVL